jgi:hypothetical protein
MMASTNTGVTVTSGAPVVPPAAIGGFSGSRALRLPPADRFGVADRGRFTGFTG